MVKIEVIGNLGADAEVKVSNGSKFVAFRVASTDKWTDDNGQKHEEVNWIDCTMANADSKVVQFLKAGVKVFVRGNAKARVYSSPKLRKMVASIQCAVMEVELCGGSSDTVPRQLIEPQTGALIDVQKYYRANADTSKWEKTDVGILLDKAGREYVMNKDCWVAPSQTEEQQQDDQADANQDANSNQ